MINVGLEKMLQVLEVLKVEAQCSENIGSLTECFAILYVVFAVQRKYKHLRHSCAVILNKKSKKV